jgi:hypothetical protein
MVGGHENDGLNAGTNITSLSKVICIRHRLQSRYYSANGRNREHPVAGTNLPPAISSMADFFMNTIATPVTLFPRSTGKLRSRARGKKPKMYDELVDKLEKLVRKESH